MNPVKWVYMETIRDAEKVEPTMAQFRICYMNVVWFVLRLY